MAKVKAGTLKPVIDQMRKTLREKGGALPPAERRAERHRLKRLQRKARRIRHQEEAVAKRGGAGTAAETAG